MDIADCSFLQTIDKITTRTYATHCLLDEGPICRHSSGNSPNFHLTLSIAEQIIQTDALKLAKQLSVIALPVP